MSRSVLFACNMNSVRSPMAEAIARHELGADWEVGSCGVYRGAIDPFVHDVLLEADIPNAVTEPREFGECNTDDYDVIVALTPEAAAAARRLHRDVEYWDVENPTDTRGGEDEIRAAYARLRDDLTAKIRGRFLAETG